MTLVLAPSGTDVMSDRIEERIRDLCLADHGFDPVRVMYRGEPQLIPVKLYPFATIFMRREGEAQNQEGMTDDTGPVRYWRYDGYISVEVLVPDTRGLIPDEDRKADVPSYIAAKTLIQTAKKAIRGWVDPDGIMLDPVVSEDGKEQTTELRTDQIQNALMSRGSDNVNNVATFAFHVYTRRHLF